MIVLSTEAVKSQKMNWSSAHALVLSMTTNLKSLVIKNCGWLGNEVGYLCMYRNSEHIPILNGSLGAWENEAEIQLGGKFSLVIKS